MLSWELVEIFASLVGGIPSFGTAAPLLPLLVELVCALASRAWERSVDIDIKFRRSGKVT